MSATVEERVCGALGCEASDELHPVTRGGRTRLLCPDCADNFLRRRR